MRTWRAVAGAVLLVLLVSWFVLSLFVLDVVTADAVNLAVALAWLVAAAFRARKDMRRRASTWLAAYLALTMPFQLLLDLATEHRWPVGQLHDLLIARRLDEVPALACLGVFFWIAVIRKRRTATRAI